MSSEGLFTSAIWRPCSKFSGNSGITICLIWRQTCAQGHGAMDQSNAACATSLGRRTSRWASAWLASTGPACAHGVQLQRSRAAGLLSKDYDIVLIARNLSLAGQDCRRCEPSV
eukprot:6462463-Amphidinium_carterae.1